MPGVNYPIWIGNDRIAILWAAPGEGNQLFLIDLTSRQIRQITHETGQIAALLGDPQGYLLYDVFVGHGRAASERLIDEGFAVHSSDAMVLLSRVVDGATAYDFGMVRRVAVQVSGRRCSHTPSLRRQCLHGYFRLSVCRAQPDGSIFSPNGRYAIVNVGLSELPPDWMKYRGFLAESISEYRRNSARSFCAMANRLMIVDLSTGKARALWGKRRAGPTFNPMPQITWSPDGKEIVVAPTPLPPESSDEAGLSGKAIAVVNVESGAFSVLPVSSAESDRISGACWLSSDRISISTKASASLEFERASQATWKLAAVSQNARPAVSPTNRMEDVGVTVEQGLNEPPVLVAIDGGSGRRRVLYDPNPKLTTRFRLGRVEFIDWTSADGAVWQGRLYYPAGYRAGQRYPLVIQTQGASDRDQYSLTGIVGVHDAGLGPSWAAFLLNACQPRYRGVASRGKEGVEPLQT